MRKPMQAKYLAPLIHALLYLVMWGLYWVFALPMANGPSALPFFVLFIADLPISFIAFGVMFTSVKYGLVAAIAWGVFGTLWWYVIGRSIDARIRNFRKTDYRIIKPSARTGDSVDGLTPESSDTATRPEHRMEWLIAAAGVFLLVVISLASNWNGPKGTFRSGRIADITFAPNGRSVLLSRSHGESSFLYKVTLDTGESARLSEAAYGTESSPAFSPDGKQVVFLYASQQTQRPRIFIADTNGGGAHTLFAAGVNTEDLSPRFSADGTKIYFARIETSSRGSDSLPPVSQRWDIYSADLRGENVGALTHQHFPGVSTLSFSNDGKKILYSTESENGGLLHIYLLDKPSEPEKTFQPHVPHESSSPTYASPGLSADGRDVYFLAPTTGSDKEFDYDVYRLELANNSIEKLTTSNGYATDLRVSGDDRSAVYLRWASRWGSLPNLSKMYLLNLSTKSLTPLNVTGTQQ
jgi:Tol biopolymer transport system component